MPNWCINDVTVSHPDRKVIRRLIRGFKRGRLFSEFMPETLMELGYRRGYRTRRRQLVKDCRSAHDQA